MTTTLYRYAIIISTILGIFVGWLLHSPAKPPPEAPAPAQRQADASLVLSRTEGTATPTPAPHTLPNGSKEERRVQVMIQPQRGQVVKPSLITPDHFASAGNKVDSMAFAHFSQPVKMVDDSCDCPPVTVDLSLVRMPDKTRRVVASSPDGQILSGVDIPIEGAPEVHVPSWSISAIAIVDLDGVKPGALLSRNLGPFVVGGGVLSDPSMRRPGAIVQAGLSW